MGLLFGAPFLLAGALAQVAVVHLGLPLALAIIFGATGLSWCGALLIMARGSAGLVEPVALAFISAAVVLVVTMAGGPGTAFGILLVVPLAEALILRGTRSALRAGLAASAVSVVAAVALHAWSGIAVPAPSAWHWLVPALSAGTIWLRLRPATTEAVEKTDATIPADPGLQLDAGGMILDALPGSGAEAWKLMTGRPLVELVNVADRVALLRALADLREGAEQRRVELRLNGGADAMPAGLFDLHLDRREDGICARFRDLSEVEALRREVQAAKDRIEAVDGTKHRFLATMSHELRTPLNSIIGFSEVLEREMLGEFSDPRQKEYVELIRKSGIHLLSIVNSILDVSKMEAGTYTIEPERFALRDVVELAVSMIAPQAGAKAITIRSAVEPAVGDVFLDRRATLQMALNLLSNGVKFTPAGGSVEVSVKRDGASVTLGVSDDGIGIAADDLKRIGTPFVQVENDYARHHDGTGLGLSLVKGLVALHKGDMTIESAPGEGTTVTLTFRTPPLAEVRTLGQAMQAKKDDDRKAQSQQGLRKTA